MVEHTGAVFTYLPCPPSLGLQHRLTRLEAFSISLTVENSAYPPVNE
jgi:hypothetical protein